MIDAQPLRVACRQRLSEAHHLGAEVVDVELPRHLVTGMSEDAAQSVAVAA